MDESRQANILLLEKFKLGSTLLVSAEGLEVVFQTKIIKKTSTTILLKNTVPPEYIKAFVHAPSYVLQFKELILSATHLKGDGIHLIYDLAHLETLEDVRSLERIEIPKDQKIYAEFLNPIDLETVLKKPVIDMSEEGLSVRTPFKSELFQQGQVFNDLKIYIDNKLQKTINAKSVYQRKFIDESGNSFYQVGLSLIAKESS